MAVSRRGHGALAPGWQHRRHEQQAGPGRTAPREHAGVLDAAPSLHSLSRTCPWTSGGTATDSPEDPSTADTSARTRCPSLPRTNASAPIHPVPADHGVPGARLPPAPARRRRWRHQRARRPSSNHHRGTTTARPGSVAAVRHPALPPRRRCVGTPTPAPITPRCRGARQPEQHHIDLPGSPQRPDDRRGRGCCRARRPATGPPLPLGGAEQQPSARPTAGPTRRRTTAAGCPDEAAWRCAGAPLRGPHQRHDTGLDVSPAPGSGCRSAGTTPPHQHKRTTDVIIDAPACTAGEPGTAIPAGGDLRGHAGMPRRAALLWRRTPRSLGRRARPRRRGGDGTAAFPSSVTSPVLARHQPPDHDPRRSSDRTPRTPDHDPERSGSPDDHPVLRRPVGGPTRAASLLRCTATRGTGPSRCDR